MQLRLFLGGKGPTPPGKPRKVRVRVQRRERKPTPEEEQGLQRRERDLRRLERAASEAWRKLEAADARSPSGLTRGQLAAFWAWVEEAGICLRAALPHVEDPETRSLIARHLGCGEGSRWRDILGGRGR